MGNPLVRGFLKFFFYLTGNKRISSKITFHRMP